MVNVNLYVVLFDKHFDSNCFSASFKESYTAKDPICDMNLTISAMKNEKKDYQFLWRGFFKVSLSHLSAPFKIVKSGDILH